MLTWNFTGNCWQATSRLTMKGTLYVYEIHVTPDGEFSVFNAATNVKEVWSTLRKAKEFYQRIENARIKALWDEIK